MIHVLLTRTPLYSLGCPSFLVRLACVRRAASVDSEPGSNSHLKFMRMAGASPDLKIAPLFTQSSLTSFPYCIQPDCQRSAQPEPASKIPEPDCRPRNRDRWRAKSEHHRKNQKFKKEPNRKAVFHFPGGPGKLCYHSLQRSLSIYRASPSNCTHSLLKPEDLKLGGSVRIPEFRSAAQDLFKKMTNTE